MTVRFVTHQEAAASGLTASEARLQAREQALRAGEEARQAGEQARQAAEQARNNVRVNRDRTITIQTPDGAVTVNREGPPLPPSFPGSLQPHGFSDGGIPPQAVDIAMGFFAMCAFIVVGWPLARAFGRRMERRGPDVGAASPLMAEQLQRIEQAVDAMAIEVERISESQRFMAKLQSANADRIGLPADRV